MISPLILLRFRLLIRQKIGWLTLLVGLLVLFMALATATVSFVSPHRIFWDFALGMSFVVLHVLSVYLAVQLFHEEKDRRTLHLILVSGVSRARWLVSNVVGLWLGLVTIDVLWFVATWLIAAISFGPAWDPLLVQVKILQSLSLAVVLSFSALFSLVVRPLLALFLSAALTFFLYSLSSIERVFLDPLTGHLAESRWALAVLKFAKFLPPLEWFDAKIFVGYESTLSWYVVSLCAGLGMAWAAVFLALASLRFSRLDL